MHITFDVSNIIDDLAKITSAVCGALTLLLVWAKAIPKIEQIHTQTNSLAQKAEAGARAEGVQEGLLQAATAANPGSHAEAILAAADVAVAKIVEAVKVAKEEEPHE